MSGRYKLWKRVRLTSKRGGIYRESEITPVSGSTPKLADILELTVVDDTPLGVGNFVWRFYLYDFEKRGQTRNRYVYKKKKNNIFIGNKFYDDSLEERLGGERQTLG